MLQITSRAVAVLTEERADRGVPNSFGLRVEQDQSDSTARLRLAFTEQPAAGDHVTESNGVRMFVASDIAEVVAQQAIDASEHSGLVLRDQSEVVEEQ
jgi:Fe-S cluster assembly iron-binding protein IscA